MKKKIRQFKSILIEDIEHDWIGVESRLKSHQNKTKFVNLKEMSLTTVTLFKDEEKNKAIQSVKNYFQTKCPKFGREIILQKANSQPLHCIKQLKKYGMGLHNVSLCFFIIIKTLREKEYFPSIFQSLKVGLQMSCQIFVYSLSKLTPF